MESRGKKSRLRRRFFVDLSPFVKWLMKIFSQPAKERGGESRRMEVVEEILLQEINDKLRFIFLDADRILFHWNKNLMNFSEKNTSETGFRGTPFGSFFRP